MTKPQRCRYQARDNAGIKSCYSVNFTRLDNRFGRILASLTRVIALKKFQKGDLIQLVVFGTRQWSYRRGGVNSKLGYNGVVALKKDGSPVGTRIHGPILLEARHAGYLRVSLLSRGII